MFKVGQEVVVFVHGRPCQHNSGNSPKHPCRGKVVKVGRLNVHVESLGAPWVIAMDGKHGRSAHTVAEAHRLHRINLASDGRTAAQVQDILSRI